LSFSGAASTDPQGETLTYAWNFGDNGTGTGVSPSHTYTSLGTYTVTLTVTNTSNLTATATVKVNVPNGRVYGGQQPISGAHVYLLSANTTGYGKPSVSLLNAASTGFSDSVGAYVQTGSDGSFFWAGDYTCTPGTQVYIYALGGNSGAGTNSASGLLAAMGNCPSTGNFSAIPYITVNEVSTIAAAYSFAGFATDATHVSSSGTALAQTGVANAFGNAANLANLSTGQALSTTPAGNGGVPQAQINTLANILSACVDTSGSSSNYCSILFSNAMSSGSSGTTPTDTATAAINIAHNPAANIYSLYGIIAATPPFAPALTALPNDFTIGIVFTVGGLNTASAAIAIDGSGNAWITNELANSVIKLSSTGAVLSGANGYTGGGLDFPYGIAIDGSGNAWITNELANSVTEFSSTGAVLSGATGYTGGGLGTPRGIAIDGAGSAWIDNASGVTKLSSTGAVLSGTNGFSGGGFNVHGIAIDGSGNAWITSIYVNSVTKLSSTGAVLSGTNGYTGGGLNAPAGIAIDGTGNAWIPNGNAGFTMDITEFSSTGAVLSGATGYSGGGLYEPGAIAIDGSGNAWIVPTGSYVIELSSAGAVLSGATGYKGGFANAIPLSTGIAIDGSGDVWITDQVSGNIELIGAGTPVVTPLATGVRNNTLGARP
jgi:PKD repeat protein